MSNYLISMPANTFSMPRQFKAIPNGRIFIGLPDTDPVNPANQIPVYIINESGAEVQVAQPIIINAGGFPVYNGQIVKFITKQNYSMAVYDSTGNGGVQQYYWPDLSMEDPAAASSKVDELRDDLANPSKGDSLIGVQQPFSGAVSRTQHQKNADILTPADFSTESDMFRALISQGKNSAVFNSRYVFTITAGIGGDYPNLMYAIVAEQVMRPLWDNGHGYCVIKLRPGYVLNTQLEFSGGVDLSWIKITSEDTIVYADTSSFTVSVRTYYDYKYLFYIHESVNSPLFAIQIEENRAGSDVCAFVVSQAATLNLAPLSGARKFYAGVHASFAARVIGHHTGCPATPADAALYMPPGYYLCDFSDSIFSGINAGDLCVVHLPLSKFDRCTGDQGGVFMIYNAIGDFMGTSASYCSTGWTVRDSAQVNMRNHRTIRCTVRGLACVHTAYVDARNFLTEEADAATSGKVLDPTYEGGFYGCALGVRIDGAGCVELAGNDMRACGIAVNADTGATVTGKAVDVSDCTLAFDCRAGATVAFPRLWGTNIKQLMHLQDGCRFNSNIAHVYGSTPTSSIRWIDNERSDVRFMSATIEADSGLMNDTGSTMCLEGCTTKVQSIRSFLGSHVVVNDSKADRTFSDAANVAQLIINSGSIISASTYTNLNSTPVKLSVAANTLSAGGIIWSPGAP